VARLIARDARRQRAEEDLQRLIDADATDDEEMLAIAKATSATPLSVDQITSIPAVNLHEQCGWFLEAQEPELYDAIQAAFDLV
jgi:S-ribosylhomocysteine lyase LuxS involved in autoinducer biosynthesis